MEPVKVIIWMILYKNECSNYFNETNYTITNSPHGPPGCWLVLGNELNKVLKKNPESKGKEFGCWANINDEKNVHPKFPVFVNQNNNY